jgi:hypothetical protein
MHHLRSGGDDGTVRRISVCYVSNIMPRWDPSPISIYWLLSFRNVHVYLHAKYTLICMIRNMNMSILNVSLYRKKPGFVRFWALNPSNCIQTMNDLYLIVC